VAEGFAEAKGKYRGSIMDSFAVVPIGCLLTELAQNPDDEVRVAGFDASYSCATQCYTATDPTVLSSVANRSTTEPDSVLWYYCTHRRPIVRRRLQSTPQRHLACADDKRNKRWPLAQSHQGTTPAVSSSTDAALRSRYQAREQKADGHGDGRAVSR
jgi:hypothetical protein